jgi:Tfp pilus assembly protein PilN
MININLLPKNFRKVERKVVLPTNAVFLSIVALLVALHLLLAVVWAYKQAQLLYLKRAWAQLDTQYKNSSSFKKEIQDLLAKIRNVETVVTRQVSLTEILSGLNAAVPKWLWLDRFNFSEQRLVIQGSVISMTQNEMTIIGKFLQDLKSNITISNSFSKIELTSVQRRLIRNYDVVDFVLTGEIKK